MYKVDFSEFANTDNRNNGICKEWAVARSFGINRTSHNNKNYIVDSDVEIDDRKISVKSRGFSLYSGTMTKGCHTFEGVWRRYYRNVHSTEWIYVTDEWVGYVMNKKEFSKFVHTFGFLTRESKKNGGGIKIQCKDNKSVNKWLEEKCA